MILAWKQKTGQACKITVIDSEEAFQFEHPDNYPYDLLLPNIQMKGSAASVWRSRCRKKRYHSCTEPGVPCIFSARPRRCDRMGYTTERRRENHK